MAQNTPPVDVAYVPSMHWLSDVVAGATLGYISGSLPLGARHTRGMRVSVTF